jgi:hypothetical protein
MKDRTWKEQKIAPAGGKLLLRPQLPELVGVDELEQRSERCTALLWSAAALTDQLPAIARL